MDIYTRFPKALKKGYDWGAFFIGYSFGVLVAIGFVWVVLWVL